TVPLVAFSVASLLSDRLAQTFGPNKNILLAMVVLVAGTVIRSIPGTSIALYVGTGILALAIGIGNAMLPSIVARDFPESIPTITGVYTAAMVGCAAVFSSAAVFFADWLSWRYALGIPAIFATIAVVMWAMRPS